jgi:hypothetical protein
MRREKDKYKKTKTAKTIMANIEKCIENIVIEFN